MTKQEPQSGDDTHMPRALGEHRYVFHYRVDDGLTYLCMADEESRRRIPFAFLQEIKNRFQATYGDRCGTPAKVDYTARVVHAPTPVGYDVDFEALPVFLVPQFCSVWWLPPEAHCFVVCLTFHVRLRLPVIAILMTDTHNCDTDDNCP